MAGVTSLVTRGRLRWILAHKSHDVAILMHASDGFLVTAREWCANRLTDVIARRRALSLTAPMAVAELLQLVADALSIEAGTLGVVTKAANRHH